jgi:integrase
VGSIRKRNGRWQAQVRKLGFPQLSKSFDRKAAANRWIQLEEARLSKSFGHSFEAGPQRSPRLADILERYRDEISPKKRGHLVEQYRIDSLLRAPLAKLYVRDATPMVFSTYRDLRLSQVSPETVRKELQILSHMFTVAEREWGLALAGNPIAQIKRPAPSEARTRRVLAGEYRRLETAARHPRAASYLWPLINFAIETAMRRGEILALGWDSVDRRKKIARLQTTKTGTPRDVPLSTCALVWLEQSPVADSDKPFPVSGNAVRLGWTRLTKRAGIEDLHFHDLRHEAISRLFEKGLSVAEVALISGHRDVRQLFRYTHLRAEDIAKKLR